MIIKYINLVDTEEKVVIWDDTMKIFVVKFKQDVKLHTFYNKRIFV